MNTEFSLYCLYPQSSPLSYDTQAQGPPSADVQVALHLTHQNLRPLILLVRETESIVIEHTCYKTFMRFAVFIGLARK